MLLLCSPPQVSKLITKSLILHLGGWCLAEAYNTSLKLKNMIDAVGEGQRAEPGEQTACTYCTPDVRRLLKCSLMAVEL